MVVQWKGGLGVQSTGGNPGITAIMKSAPAMEEYYVQSQICDGFPLPQSLSFFCSCWKPFCTGFTNRLVLLISNEELMTNAVNE